MTEPDVSSPAPSHHPTPLRELAVLFMKLGTIAFGGPAAHIAMMEDEVVRRRGWLTQQAFLDMLGATNLIPGPNSTELAIHIGYERGRLPGLIVAGSCFIGPAVLIVSAIAWAYVRYGQLPISAAVLYGIKPVIIAIVLQALWRLGRSALKTTLLAAVFAVAAIASLAGVNELVVLFGGAAVVALLRRFERSAPPPPAAALPLPALPMTATVATGAAATTAAASVPVSLLPLFLIFLKIGSVLFGSGYVLLAFLRADFVQRLHWLSESQLLDATAVGQVTPGPVFTTATFIGYVLAGPKGAVVATLGIFLPAFVFVALSAPLIPRLRRMPVTADLLDGLNTASLALMAVVTWQLTRAAVVDWLTLCVAIVSAVLLLRFRLNATWLIALGAVAGVVHVLT